MVFFSDCLTIEMPLEKPDMGTTGSNILIGNNCKDMKLHFRMAWGCEDYHNKGQNIDESYPIANSS
jgi:hypothetical protein